MTLAHAKGKQTSPLTWIPYKTLQVVLPPSGAAPTSDLLLPLHVHSKAQVQLFPSPIPSLRTKHFLYGFCNPSRPDL